MASILDYFSGKASPEDRAGLAGLAAMFNGALGDGSRPVNFGAALSAGALGMQQGRQSHAEQERERQRAEQQAAMRALQMRAAQADLSAQEQAQGQQAAIQQAAQSAVGPDGQFDQDAFLRNIRSVNALKALDYERQLAKAAPEYDTTPQVVNGPDGKPMLVQLSKTAAPRVLDGFKPREKAELVNLGGKSVAVNPFDVAPGQQFERTMTPGEAASNSIARANLGISQQRLALDRQAQAGGPKAPPGYRWTADGKMEAIPGGPADQRTSKEGVQRVQDARDVLSILGEAEPLLSKSTSSYAGAGIDQVARIVGASTAGGEAAAQLKVLQGQLVAKQPKMSGPQSDKDVQLYREMAGQIGDPTLPESTRRAALQTIRKLSQKYLNETGAAGAAPAAGGGVKFLGFE